MKGMKKIVFAGLLCIVAASLFAQTEVLFEKNLETTKVGLLSVLTESADIDISVWNKRRVMVVVRGLKKTEKVLNISVTENDGGISVSVKKAENRKLLGWGGIQFTSVEILVPESWSVRAGTGGGDIKINNVTGSVELDSGGGDITAAATSGEFRAYSASGDISLSGNTGPVDLSSGGGDIRAVLIQGVFKAISDSGDVFYEGSDGSVSVYSASGDCAIQYRGKNRGLDIRTSSGNITLVVPEELDAKIECTSGSGVVTTSFPSATVLAKSATNYEAALNGGGEKIILRTQSGIIDAAAR